MTQHIDELERMAAEMPVDILAHPTLLPLPIRNLPVDELWTDPLEERLVEALFRGEIAFEVSNRYRPHERLVQRAHDRGVRLSLGSDGHTRAQVGDLDLSARDGEARWRGRERALRSVRARDARRSVIRYHARWVLPISSPPIRDGTVVELAGRIVYVGPRDDAPDASTAPIATSATARSCRGSSTRTRTSSSPSFADCSRISLSANGSRVCKARKPRS